MWSTTCLRMLPSAAGVAPAAARATSALRTWMCVPAPAHCGPAETGRSLAGDGHRSALLFDARDDADRPLRRIAAATPGGRMAPSARPSPASGRPWPWIAELGQRIDTSDLAANTLRNWVKSFVGLEPSSQITVCCLSPSAARSVLDLRSTYVVCPNPHYDPLLRPHRPGWLQSSTSCASSRKWARWWMTLPLVASWLPSRERANAAT